MYNVNAEAFIECLQTSFNQIIPLLVWSILVVPEDNILVKYPIEIQVHEKAQDCGNEEQDNDNDDFTFPEVDHSCSISKN